MKKLTKATKSSVWVLSGLIGLILAYFLLTRALDTGSYWQYLGSVVFLFLSVRLFLRTFKKSYGK